MPGDDVFGSLYDILAKMKAEGIAGGGEEAVAAARHSRRMAAAQRLVEQGATPGEREAAEAAMHRMQMDALDAEADDYIPL